VTELQFLSPDLAQPWEGLAPRLESPLAHAFGAQRTHASVRDVSLKYAKIEVRGPVEGALPDVEVVRITSERALVLCPYERGTAVRRQLGERFSTVVDLTGALAGLELDSATLVRRLTDLDLEALPAVGSIAHVPGLLLGDGGERFRLFFPQEYGDYMVEVVLDTVRGIR